MRFYQRVFIEANGPGPWPCHFCAKEVPRFGRGYGLGVIHHYDGDFENNDPGNLKVKHSQCHSYEHHAGEKHSAEHNAKVGRKGRVFTKQWKAKIAASAQRIAVCSCGYTSSPQAVGRHKKRYGHA